MAKRVTAGLSRGGSLRSVNTLHIVHLWASADSSGCADLESGFIHTKNNGPHGDKVICSVQIVAE